MRYRCGSGLPDGPQGHAGLRRHDTGLGPRAQRRGGQALATTLRGRLDEVEFKNRLDIAMSATTRQRPERTVRRSPSRRCPVPLLPHHHGTAASCRGSSSWPSSPSRPGRPCPSTPSSTSRGSSSPSSDWSCGGGPVGALHSHRRHEVGAVQLGHRPLRRHRGDTARPPAARNTRSARHRPHHSAAPADDSDAECAVCQRHCAP